MMNHFFRKATCVCLWISFYLFVYGQSYRIDFEKMNATFWESPSFYTKMETRFYGPDRASLPDQVMTGVIARKDSCYYYAWDENELVVLHEHVILINHAMKTMVLRKMTNGSLFSPALMMQQMPALLDEYGETVTLLSSEADVRCYRISPENSLITGVEWCVDAGTGWMSRLDYTCKDRRGGEERIEIHFSDTCLSEDYPPFDTDPGTYFQQTKSGCQPVEKYKGYRLVSD